MGYGGGLGGIGRVNEYENKKKYKDKEKKSEEIKGTMEDRMGEGGERRESD